MSVKYIQEDMISCRETNKSVIVRESEHFGRKSLIQAISNYASTDSTKIIIQMY